MLRDDLRLALAKSIFASCSDANPLLRQPASAGFLREIILNQVPAPAAVHFLLRSLRSLREIILSLSTPRTLRKSLNQVICARRRAFLTAIPALSARNHSLAEHAEDAEEEVRVSP
jgi:hypothetical protein